MTEIIRIASVSDLHIDVTNRFEETNRVLDWIADDIGRREVDILLNGGDTFERKPTRQCSLAAGRFSRKGVRNTRWRRKVGVRGNHDADASCLDDLSHHNDEDETSIYGALADDCEIKFYSRPAIHRVGGIQIACLPWPRYQGKIGDSYEEGRTHLRNVLRGLGQEMDALRGPRIFLGHVNRIGAKVSEASQPLVPGDGIDVGDEDLALVRAHCYLFGHIHFGQQWSINGAPAIYPGAPKRVNWGETETKWYTIVELDARTGEVRDVEMIETPCTRMVKLEARFRDGAIQLEAEDVDVEGAEVRLRYHTPAEHLASAKVQAENLEREWLRLGAVRVDLEQATEVQTHARVPEIATATTVTEALDAMRRARGESLAPELKAQLDACLAEIEAELPERSRTSTGASCELEKVKLKGIGPAFPNEVEIDFTQIPGRLNAVVGENMAGKTTLCEAIGPGLWYRDCPTRGSLKELSTPGSFIEGTYRGEGDRRFTIRHDNDGISAGQAMATDETGRPLLENRNVSTFDAWAKDTLPPQSLAEVSLFTPQWSKGILGMTSGDRKAVLLRAIGVDLYEALAKKASGRATLAKKDHDAAERRLSDERSRSTPVDVAVQHTAKARSLLDRATHLASDEGASLALEREAAQRALHSNLERDQILRRRFDELFAAENAKNNASARIQSIDAQVADLQWVSTDGATIAAAAKRVAEIEPQLAEAKGRVDTSRDAHRSASVTLSGARAGVQRARGALDRVIADVEAEAKRETERCDLAAQAARIPQAEADVETYAAKLREAETALGAIQERRAADDGTRITHLRGGLEWYATGDIDDGVRAADALAEDDDEVKKRAHLPAELRAAQNVLRMADSAAKGSVSVLARLREDKAKLDAMAPREGLDEARATAEADLAHAEAHLRDANVEFSKVDVSRATDTALVAELTRELDSLSGDAMRLPQLEAAKARYARLTEERAEAVPAFNVASAGLEAVVAFHAAPAPELLTVPDVAQSERRAAEAERARADAQSTLALAERAETEAKAAFERLTVLEQEYASASTVLANWTRLSAELGRDGLQAIAIDAAGPELSALTNTFLHECINTRWTFRLDTMPKSEDSSQEPCEPWAFDSEIGRWMLAKRLSGCGKFVVGEAFSWAIIAYVCRRWRIKRPLIIRDEAGATMLSPEYAMAVVTMWRRAIDLIGASRVLVVTHDAAVHERVDARVRIADGQITIES